MNYHLLDKINGFLEKINYEELFSLIPIMLLGVMSLTILITYLLTLFSSTSFGNDHSRVLQKNAAVCFWVSLFSQFVLWIWASNEIISYLYKIDLLTALILAGMILLTLLTSALQMIFKQKGARVFSSRKLISSVGSMMLYVCVLLLYTYLFMRI